MKKTISSLIIIIILLAIILIYKININKKEKDIKLNNNIKTNTIIEKETESIKENTKKEVKIINHKKDIYGKIEVIIKNNTGKNLKQVIIKAQCYDKDGNNLGITSNGQYNINTIDNYKITIFAKIDTYKYNLKIEYE